MYTGVFGTWSLRVFPVSTCLPDHSFRHGVLCISGDVHDLSEEQWEIVQRGTDFYKKVTSVIANGITVRSGPFQKSNRALYGYQATVRYASDNRALAIVHFFEEKKSGEVSVPIAEGYRVSDIYETGDHRIAVTGDELNMSFKKPFDAVAVLLEKQG